MAQYWYFRDIFISCMGGQLIRSRVDGETTGTPIGDAAEGTAASTYIIDDTEVVEKGEGEEEEFEDDLQ